MAIPSKMKFFVGYPPVAITAASDQWHMSLPVNRSTATSAAAPPSLTYGDYFTAVRDFLTRCHLQTPLRAIEQVLGHAADHADIDVVHVHLVKHGAFYHPALVTLLVGRVRVPFVLNVAVSPIGRARLFSEVDHLRRLGREFPKKFIPDIYSCGAGRINDRFQLPMFAGQWLSGYHELHPCPRDDAGPTQWLVWDTDNGKWRLNQAQAEDFFHKAVFILTYYFDPHTLSAVMEWHHAAGDFVAGKFGRDIDVRLITVRRYGPLFQLENEETPTLEILMNALVVFFLKTSLWMRLDRLDGTGDLVWADDWVLAPIWQGFIQGLEHMAQLNGFPVEFVDGVTRYLAAHTLSELDHLGLALVNRFPGTHPEAILIKHHLGQHMAHLISMIQEYKQAS